jgi:pimeloyl-ACP methyl ester carboxylesterase
MITESFPTKLPDPIRALYPFRTRMVHVAEPAAKPALNGEVPGSRRPQPGDSAGPYERMSFVDEGPEQAPPLVLVHGNLTWSFLFRKLIAEARRHHRVIAPDLVGFGLSSKPHDAAHHTLERHTENLSQLLAELKLPKLTLVLHGMAGIIGFRYAMRFPENVARIVLINAWVHPQAADAAERLPFWPAVARGRMGFMLRHWTLTPFPVLQWAAAKTLEGPVRDGYGIPFQRSDQRAAPLAFARMFQPNSRESQLGAMRELAPQVAKLPAKVQILWGQQDSTFRSKLLPYLLRDSLPHCGEPVFVPQASHLLPEDAPEVLAENVLETGRTRSDEPLFKIL